MNIKQQAITLLCLLSLFSLPACCCKKNKNCKREESTELVDNRSINHEADALQAQEDFFFDDEAVIVLDEKTTTKSSVAKF